MIRTLKSQVTMTGLVSSEAIPTSVVEGLRGNHSLTAFIFDGLFEYLGYFVAQIYSPQRERLQIKYIDENESAEFEMHGLCKFIDRAENFKQDQFRYAELDIPYDTALVKLDGGRKDTNFPS